MLQNLLLCKHSNTATWVDAKPLCSCCKSPLHLLCLSVCGLFSLSLSLFYFLCVGLVIGPFCLFLLLLVITVVVVAVCFVVSPKQQQRKWRRRTCFGVLIQIRLKVFFTSLFSIPHSPIPQDYILQSLLILFAFPPPNPFFFSLGNSVFFAIHNPFPFASSSPIPTLSLFMCFLFNCISPPDFVLELFWVVLLLLDFLLLAPNYSVSVSLTVSQRTCLSQISLSLSVCLHLSLIASDVSFVELCT